NDPKLGQRDGSLSLKGYGVRKTMFINFLSQCSMMGKNLIFVAHEREEKDGENRIVRPEIGGSSAGDLIKELDLVGYMQAIGSERTISWSPTEKFYAKNTCNLPPMQKIPIIIDASGNVTGQNIFLSSIFDSYQAYLKKQADISNDYEALIDVVKENVELIVDADTANAVTENMGKLQHIWDSKLKAGLMIRDKCNSLGLKLNKLTKKYEPADAAATA
ncbi:AAA family ATPase, partial [Parabacteroides goldsteinii]|uniref:AAA family ATPase n=1 Tax=Parabacteroides goldsteinii TaxID=328812 RepID=UPI00257076CD